MKPTTVELITGKNALYKKFKKLVPRKHRHLAEFYVDEETDEEIIWEFDYKGNQYTLVYRYETKKITVTKSKLK